MRSPLSLLLVLVLACGFAAAQSKPQSDSQDDNIPVLKRRPPANDAGQSTGPAPENAPSQPANGPDQTPPTNTNGVHPAASSQGTSTPVGPHPDHHAEMMRHGAEVMGFDQQTTTHHFLLTRSGGVIRVITNDPNDATGAGHISIHLRDAASRFARGDFSAPEHTHGQMPPGVAVMQQLRRKIIYTAHSIAGGAELIITSEDPRAINAIHDFLQFQIRDHQTGDPIAVR